MGKKSEVEDQSRRVLEGLLKPIPFIKAMEWEAVPELDQGLRADFIASVIVDGQELRLVGEIKEKLPPRFVPDAIRQVRECCSLLDNESVYPVVVSEYISPRSAEILQERNVSYFDWVGNARLCFANVYIVKEGKAPEKIERRQLRSLFGLKSSRMLRLMLSEPARAWQVKELSARAGLSLGQVSNVRRSLLDQNFAIEIEGGGISINQPAALLDVWQRSYKQPVVDGEQGYYSLLNPGDRLAAIKKAIIEAGKSGAGIMLGGLSAARWQAPFAKAVSEWFYADEVGREILKDQLKLEPVSVGPNVFIKEPKDSFIFKEAVECAQGLRCTHAIQTYLDLYVSGEREKEAAEHIRSQVLEKQWHYNLKEQG